MRSNRSISWLGRFIAATCTAAATNFVDIFSQTMKAANASGTHVVDGYEFTVCYFGPPLPFYPRFLVFGALLLATVGVVKQTFLRRVMVVVSLIGGLIVYFYWWMHSYQVFRNFTDFNIDFLNNAEIKQVAYLYEGGWLGRWRSHFDCCIAGVVARSANHWLQYTQNSCGFRLP